MNQKLERVLAVVLEQKETGRKCWVLYQHGCTNLFFSFSCKAREGNC